MTRSTPGNPALTCICILAAMLSSTATAAGLSFESGPQRVSLVELFTSEGCSSCPPAERWLSGLQEEPQLWIDFVPIAFHVDYWDDLGWPDRFADAKFSDRQRDYARGGNLPAVYTPGFVLNGREWRGWRAADGPPAPAEKTGRLSVRADAQGISIIYAPETMGAGARLFASVALLGFDLESDVTAGENRGRSLEHDFVALDVRRVALSPDHDRYRAGIPMPASRVDAAVRALVAWVSNRESQAPLQAVGGWLPEYSPADAVSACQGCNSTE